MLVDDGDVFRDICMSANGKLYHRPPPASPRKAATVRLHRPANHRKPPPPPPAACDDDAANIAESRTGSAPDNGANAMRVAAMRALRQMRPALHVALAESRTERPRFSVVSARLSASAAERVRPLAGSLSARPTSVEGRRPAAAAAGANRAAAAQPPDLAARKPPDGPPVIRPPVIPLWIAIGQGMVTDATRGFGATSCPQDGANAPMSYGAAPSSSSALSAEALSTAPDHRRPPPLRDEARTAVSACAAEAFDHKLYWRTSNAERVHHVKERRPGLYLQETRAAFCHRVEEVSRTRYFEPDEGTVGLETRPKRGPKPFDLYSSIWRPRVSWCDAKSFYDTPEVKFSRFALDWRRVVRFGAVKLIMSHVR